jgi:RimJ/RimL family protein N-acetyltransferase
VLRLRAAEAGDSALLLRWRNDPSTREQSFHSNEIDADAHEEWFERKLAAISTTSLFILEWNGKPIGQARIDATTDDRGEISVSLDATARGQGLGVELIERATARAAEDLDLVEVDARIKATNTASRRAFAAAGYAEQTALRDADEGVVVLRWARRAI